MISAVCLNPCLDKTVEIEAFTYGGMNRILRKRMDASGKGVNVAIAAAQLGLSSFCTGFLYKDNGQLVLQRLEDAGVPHAFVWCEGEVRTNTKVFDLQNRVITEINESGTPVGQADIEQLLHQVHALSAQSELMVFSGSIPPGCPDTIYRDLMRSAAPAKCILDTEGSKLLYGLEEKPYLIKPNRFELETICGRALPTVKDLHAAALTLIDRGVSIVAVSLGAEGALITNGVQAYVASALPVPVRSTVGAGDSMVAAMCLAITEGLSLREIFRYAMAGGTAGVMNEGTSLVDRDDFHRLLPQMRMEEI